MDVEEFFRAALVERFGDYDPVVGVPPGPLITFAAKNPSIGNVTISRPSFAPSTIGQILLVQVAIGDLYCQEFENFDDHLDAQQRTERLTRDVARFLQELFADRLVFWQATDGRGRGWREYSGSGSREPLVSDDRTYCVYLWSGALGEWRASPGILARGRIRDEREYHILRVLMASTGPDALNDTERTLVQRMMADFERGM